MINLLDYKGDIKSFIISTLNNFTTEHGAIYALGVYSCPRYGWVSLNFNISSNTSIDNCPDFEFVEYDIISFEDWENESEEEDANWYDINGDLAHIRWDDGDETLNGLIFHFIKSIIMDLKDTHALPLTLVQILDSTYTELIK